MYAFNLTLLTAEQAVPTMGLAEMIPTIALMVGMILIFSAVLLVVLKE